MGMGASAIGQGVSNGWSNIDWGLVAIDGLFGIANGALITSSFGGVATGFLMGLSGFAQDVVTDLYQNNGNFKKVNWLKATLYGVFNGAIAGVAKSLIQNTKLMNKFINKLPAVKSAAQFLNGAVNVMRATYVGFWKNIMIGQGIYKYGIKFLSAILRGGINAIIKLPW